jgi:hypothetical protein
MNNKKKIAFIIVTSIILFILIATVPYINARNIALKSLHIVTIHDKDSFQQVKNEIYDIVAPEVQQSLFDREFPVDRNYPIITYQINKVHGRIVGFNHYEFIVNWTSNGYFTINSIISVKDGIVYDSQRLDL